MYVGTQASDRGANHCANPAAKGEYETRNSSFIFWINANKFTCVIVYQYNNVIESNCIVVAIKAHYKSKQHSFTLNSFSHWHKHKKEKARFIFKDKLVFLHLHETVEGLYFQCSLSVCICVRLFVCVCLSLNKFLVEQILRKSNG